MHTYLIKFHFLFPFIQFLAVVWFLRDLLVCILWRDDKALKNKVMELYKFKRLNQSQQFDTVQPCLSMIALEVCVCVCVFFFGLFLFCFVLFLFCFCFFGGRQRKRENCFQSVQCFCGFVRCHWSCCWLCECLLSFVVSTCRQIFVSLTMSLLSYVVFTCPHMFVWHSCTAFMCHWPWHCCPMLFPHASRCLYSISVQLSCVTDDVTLQVPVVLW